MNESTNHLGETTELFIKASFTFSYMNFAFVTFPTEIRIRLKDAGNPNYRHTSPVPLSSNPRPMVCSEADVSDPSRVMAYWLVYMLTNLREWLCVLCLSLHVSVRVIHICVTSLSCTGICILPSDSTL